MAKKQAAKDLAAKVPAAKKRGPEVGAAAGNSPPKRAKKAGAAAAAEPAAAAAGSPKKQPAAAAAKPAPTGGGAAEIDDLFGQLKGKKQAAAEAAAKAEAPASPIKGGKGKAAKKERLVGSKDDIFGTEAAAARKRTEEGFAIYSEAELGFGKSGGDTDKCPFDCDCCF